MICYLTLEIPCGWHAKFFSVCMLAHAQHRCSINSIVNTITINDLTYKSFIYLQFDALFQARIIWKKKKIFSASHIFIIIKCVMLIVLVKSFFSYCFNRYYNYDKILKLKNEYVWNWSLANMMLTIFVTTRFFSLKSVSRCLFNISLLTTQRIHCKFFFKWISIQSGISTNRPLTDNYSQNIIYLQ